MLSSFYSNATMILFLLQSYLILFSCDWLLKMMKESDFSYFCCAAYIS